MRPKANQTSTAKAEVIRVRRAVIADRIVVAIVDAAGGRVVEADVDAVAVDVPAVVVAEDGTVAAVVVDATNDLPRIFTDLHG